MSYQDDEDDDMAALDESRLEALLATVDCLSDMEAVPMLKSRLKPNQLDEFFRRLPEPRSSALKTLFEQDSLRPESASEGRPDEPGTPPAEEDELEQADEKEEAEEAPRAKEEAGAAAASLPSPEAEGQEARQSEEESSPVGLEDTNPQAPGSQDCQEQEGTKPETSGPAGSKQERDETPDRPEPSPVEAGAPLATEPTRSTKVIEPPLPPPMTTREVGDPSDPEPPEPQTNQETSESLSPGAPSSLDPGKTLESSEVPGTQDPAAGPSQSQSQNQSPSPDSAEAMASPNAEGEVEAEAEGEVEAEAEGEGEAPQEDVEVMTTASPVSDGIVEAWIIGRDGNNLPTSTPSSHRAEARSGVGKPQEIRAASPGQFNYRAQGGESVEELETRLDRELHGAPVAAMPEDAEFVTQANYLLSLGPGGEREAALDGLSLEELALLFCNIDSRRGRPLVCCLSPERRTELKEMLPFDKASRLGLVPFQAFEGGDPRSPSSASSSPQRASDSGAVGSRHPDDDEFLPLPPSDRFASVKTTAGAIAGIAAMAASEGSSRAAEKFRGFSERARTSEFGEKAMHTSSKAFDAAGSAANKAAHSARSGLNQAAEKVRTSELPDRAIGAASTAAVLARAGTADLAEKAKHTAASMKEKVNASSAAGAAKSGLSSMSKSMTSFLKKRDPGRPSSGI